MKDYREFMKGKGFFAVIPPTNDDLVAQRLDSPNGLDLGVEGSREDNSTREEEGKKASNSSEEAIAPMLAYAIDESGWLRFPKIVDVDGDRITLAELVGGYGPLAEIRLNDKDDSFCQLVHLTPERATLFRDQLNFLLAKFASQQGEKV